MNGEDVERRLHWLKLARELGQDDDFRALMDDLRREGAEEARRGMRPIFLMTHHEIAPEHLSMGEAAAHYIAPIGRVSDLPQEEP